MGLPIEFWAKMGWMYAYLLQDRDAILGKWATQSYGEKFNRHGEN